MDSFISIKTGLSYEDMGSMRKSIREGLERVKLSEKPIRPGDTVAVKLNISASFEPDKAVCTHPEVVRAAVEELKDLGTRVLLVEDCYDSSAPQVSGVLKVAEDTGVEFLNLRDRRYKEVALGEKVYHYYEDILNADHLILIPKMKTHVLTNYTGAIKLMFGSVTKKQRTSFHQYTDPVQFAEILVDIFSVKIPALVIMDGIVSMDGPGPTHGTPNSSGLFLVSNDAVLTDFYASMLMKYQPFEIDMIDVAYKRGMMLNPLEDANVLGDDFRAYSHKFALLPVFKGLMRQRFMKLAVGIPQLNENRCKKCGICISNCPFNAIEMKDGHPAIDPLKCRQCFCCMEFCKAEAFVFKSEKVLEGGGGK